jgi:hypothetical protein
MDDLSIDSQLIDNIFKFASIKHILNSNQNNYDTIFDLLEEIGRLDSEFKLSIKGRLPKDYPWMLSGRKDELNYYEKQFDDIENKPYLSNNVNFEGYTNTISEWYRKIGFVLSFLSYSSFYFKSKLVPIILCSIICFFANIHMSIL